MYNWENFLVDFLDHCLKLNCLLPKSILIPLRLKAEASQTDETIQKKAFGSGTATLINSNGEMNNIMKIVESLEESILLIKGVCETIKIEEKKQKDRFFDMFLGTLVY